MRYLFSITLLLLAYSCSNDKEYPKDAIILTENNIPPLLYIEAEKIELPDDLFLNSSFWVYKDTILLAINRDVPNPTFLTIMNLNNFEILGNYYAKGEGPGEVINIFGILDHNCLMVTDWATDQKSVFNIDSALQMRDNYKPIVFTSDANWVYFDWFSDSTLLVQNRPYIEDAGKYNTNDVTREFFISDMVGKHDSVPVPENVIFSTSTGGVARANEKLKKIFCAYLRWPKYKLLDYDMNVLKTICGPDDYLAVEYGPDAEGYNMVILNGYHAYNTVIQSNDEYIYVTCDRIIEIPESFFSSRMNLNQGIDELSIEHEELYQFDWDGNMVGRYKVKGNSIRTISLSEKDPKLIYFTGYNEDRELCLFKTHLP